MIAFVSQLLLMMQPCFAVKMLGDFRINIKKKEIEKAIESVWSQTRMAKMPTMLFDNF